VSRLHRSHAPWLALVSLALGAVSCGGDSAEATLRGVVRAPALQVGSIALPDAATGTSTPMVAPAGELYLVYFGYTSCPDVCPTTLSDIRVALGDLPTALADRVTVAMTTLDPERDTDEVLTGYLAHFFENSIALRDTDAAELATAAETFGVKWEVEAHEAGQPYGVSHSAVTYVVDDTGTVVVEWPFGFDTADMTADLRTLLEEEPT
jgi:protein SCO1/2